jgi:hypothetical protein
VSRWYDKKPKLGNRLDELKEMEQDVREPILNDIISLVERVEPSLLQEKTTESFRFNSTRLRWYEHDPHCWLVFNLLEFAGVVTIELVVNYLEQSLLSRIYGKVKCNNGFDDLSETF